MTTMFSAAGFPVYIKDPGARKDFGINWIDWLAGDTLVSSVWTVPAGLTNVSSENSFTTTASVAWISGGTLNKRYTLTCRIVTTLGRIEDRSIEILCRSQ